jgi:hypothetical protein
MNAITKDFVLPSQRELGCLFNRIFALFSLFFIALGAQGQAAPSPVPVAHSESAPQISPALPDAPRPAVQSSEQAPQPTFALSTRQRFSYATGNAFGVPSLVFAAAGAGVNQASNLYPDFRQGAEGYGRFFWHSYGDQAVDSYFVNFILPQALHTDPRYHPLHSGSAWARLKHTGGSVVLTHTSSGRLIFNTPQVLGSGMAASVSSLYYPERDRTASLVTQRWASNLAGDALMLGLREFAPEIVGVGKRVCSVISFGEFLCKDSDSVDR